MFERRCSPGQTLIRQGDEGDFFYVVDHGRFVASQGGRTRFVYEGTGESQQQLLRQLVVSRQQTALKGGGLAFTLRMTVACFCLLPCGRGVW